MKYKGLDFDDILLVPKKSYIHSRSDVDISIELSSTLKLDIPIIASPMKGIVSPELIMRLSDLGGIGILHRFYKSKEEFYKDADEIRSDASKFGLSIGLNDDSYKELLDRYRPNILCIDIANGYLVDLQKFALEVKEFSFSHGYDTLIMAGNVVDFQGALDLYNYGVDLIRVGIGSGSLCTTRLVTGVGYPQLSAIMDTSVSSLNIISDGGIRSSGDIVKALAFGAKAVMIGSMFAETFESSNNGIIYGMASRQLQEEYYHNIKSVEGISREVRKTKSLETLIDELSWGIKSACTYLNAKNLDELRKDTTFVEVR